MTVDRPLIPASVLSTPTSASRSCSPNPAAAYPTPESLPYRRPMSALHTSGYLSTPSPSLCPPLPSQYHTPVSVDADGDDDLVDPVKYYQCDHAREECKRLLEELAIEKQLLGVAAPNLQAAYVASQEIERMQMARENLIGRISATIRTS